MAKSQRLVGMDKLSSSVKRSIAVANSYSHTPNHKLHPATSDGL